MDRQEKKGIRMNVEQRRALMVELSKRRDERYRKAREDFRRPAFAGTELASRQQDM